MCKINLKKILATFLLSLVLFTSTSNYVETTDSAYTCSEGDTKPPIPPITYH